jgi:sortase (surface protein transpeptidase)
VRLTIPSARVRARIVPIGARRARLTIPPVTRAGWYDGGARPGEPGHTVIVGHIDSYRGPGVFAHLGSVRRGARIAVTDRRGFVRRFSVVGKAVVPKSRFPSHVVFGPSRHPVLVLVTCGGTYRHKRYRDNVIVFARARA